MLVFSQSIQLFEYLAFFMSLNVTLKLSVVVLVENVVESELLQGYIAVLSLSVARVLNDGLTLFQTQVTPDMFYETIRDGWTSITRESVSRFDCIMYI